MYVCIYICICMIMFGVEYMYVDVCIYIYICIIGLYNFCGYGIIWDYINLLDTIWFVIFEYEYVYIYIYIHTYISTGHLGKHSHRCGKAMGRHQENRARNHLNFQIYVGLPWVFYIIYTYGVCVYIYKILDSMYYDCSISTTWTTLNADLLRVC